MIVLLLIVAGVCALFWFANSRLTAIAFLAIAGANVGFVVGVAGCATAEMASGAKWAVINLAAVTGGYTLPALYVAAKRAGCQSCDGAHRVRGDPLKAHHYCLPNT